MSAPVSVWSQGIALHVFSPIGDLSYATTWPGVAGGGGGFLSASWSMTLPKSFNHPALSIGSLVELRQGAYVVGRGVMAEPDRSSWTFTIDGVMRQGEKYQAVNSSGAPSNNLATVVTAAIGRGMPWKVQGSLPSVTVGTDPTAYGTVTDLLNAYCLATSNAWWIDNASWLNIGPEATTPTWALSPATPSMESADDDFYTRYTVAYVSAINSTTGDQTISYAVASNSAWAARWGVVEAPIQDITSLGLISSTTAQNIANAGLAANGPRPAFTSGVAVADGALTNLGGVDASQAPLLVHAGQMVRHHGWRNLSGTLTPGMSLDWIIGGTTWDATNGLQLTPMGMAPRTQLDVLAAQLTQAAA